MNRPLDPKFGDGEYDVNVLGRGFRALDVFPVLGIYTPNHSDASCVSRDLHTTVHNPALARIEFLINTLVKICL
jgi:hypothetical protein